MGAAFESGGWVEVPPTFLIYDTAADSVEAFRIETTAAGRVVVPHSQPAG
jgi:hypothetical protein